jgi:GNAT superfamily N-acetyltransferase
MTFPVTVREVYSWESQVCQYQDAQPPTETGITYFPGPLPGGVVDCLLYWFVEEGRRPRIVGILNHYPFDNPPFEQKGNVNVWVRRPNQRQGIGTALVQEADRRWGPINLAQQRFTASGAALAQYLTERPAQAQPRPTKG